MDSAQQEWGADEFWKLGLGEPMPVSAYHGRGVGDLLDAVVGAFPGPDEPFETTELPRIAIVGRPNTGKSTLLNRLVGEERVIVSERPGTTRDPIDVDVNIEGVAYRLVDTAGIRRKPQITEDADFYAVIRAREALERADVAILMIDATEGVTHQDQRIASEIVDAGVGLVILLNKWDARGAARDHRAIAARSVLVRRLGTRATGFRQDRSPGGSCCRCIGGSARDTGKPGSHRCAESPRQGVDCRPPSSRAKRTQAEAPLRRPGRYRPHSSFSCPPVNWARTTCGSSKTVSDRTTTSPETRSTS